MGIKFNEAQGKAKKLANSYEYKDGENTLRFFGDIMPRYIYWLKGAKNNDLPAECLSFDRKEERFTNIEKDWVKEYFPDKKCGWAYVIQAIDPVKGEVVLVNLKKKLFEQIKTAAEDLGDPTDPETGWDIVFKRVKTGPMAFNVEYTLQVLRCKKRALSDAEKEMVANAKSIEEIMPRHTADEQKKFLEEQILSGGTAGGEKVPDELGGNVEQADDLPS